jgi:uncharacterized protein (TIGR00290 family)
VAERILVSWSGGKDSAMTLYEIQKDHDVEVAALLTTVTEGYDRVSMHGVRRALLERQAESLGFELEKIVIPQKATNEVYETEMKRVLTKYQEGGVRSVAFGDIFLEDLRKYREENLAKIGMNGLFPIWKRDTAELARTFISLGFRAVITCLDPKYLAPPFAGRIIDEGFLRDLPAHVDPCGENGEFHTFVFAGPIFTKEIAFSPGEMVLRDSFWFCDLVPKE